MVEVFILIMGVVAGAGLTGKQKTRAREENDFAWRVFLTEHRSLRMNQGNKRLFEREIVHFDWMMEQGMMPPGHRLQRLHGEDSFPSYLPAGFVEEEDHDGVMRTLQILNAEVLMLNNQNDVEGIQRIFNERFRDGKPYRILMHQEPNPESPPVEGSGIKKAPYHSDSSKVMISLMEDAGAYPAQSHDGEVLEIAVGQDAQGGFEQNRGMSIQAAVAALRAGFILAYGSPSKGISPNFIVLHPWPKNVSRNEGPWRGEHRTGTGILNLPRKRRERDLLARNNIRLGYGLPIEESPLFRSHNDE